MKKNLFLFLIFLLVGLSITSCSKSDDDDFRPGPIPLPLIGAKFVTDKLRYKSGELPYDSSPHLCYDIVIAINLEAKIYNFYLTLARNKERNFLIASCIYG